jgi:NifB/MoaA-like Fe-S oxidoreductase
MFRSGEEYFLDDVTKADLERELKVKVTIVPRDGEALLRAIMGLENTDFRRQIYEQADRGDRWQA